jgi:hypothetical protein
MVSTWCLPIVVVEIDSYYVVNKIHATHFWVITLSTLGGFIECRNGSNLRMCAFTLYIYKISYPQEVWNIEKKIIFLKGYAEIHIQKLFFDNKKGIQKIVVLKIQMVSTRCVLYI